MKKYIFGAVLSIGLLVSPAFTQAAGLTTVQINAILSLLSSFGADQSVINNVQASLTGSAPTTEGQSFCHNFNSDLKIGDQNGEVAGLLGALIREKLALPGDGGGGAMGQSAGNIVRNFDETIAAGVVQFQAKYGIRQTGYVGPMTRAKLNSLYGCKIQLPSVVRSINILSPNGGEYFSPGGKITVSFSGAGQADQYKIDLFSTFMAGDYNIYNLGTITGQKADLTIPTSVNLTPVPTKGGNSTDISGSYRIRVSQITNQGVLCTSWNKDSCLQSESNYFTISTVNVSAPIISASSSSVKVGSTITINGSNFDWVPPTPCEGNGCAMRSEQPVSVLLTNASGQYQALWLGNLDSKNTITVTIPSGQPCVFASGIGGCARGAFVITPGQYSISVSVDGRGTSNILPLTVQY